MKITLHDFICLLVFVLTSRAEILNERYPFHIKLFQMAHVTKKNYLNIKCIIIHGLGEELDHMAY